MTVTVSILIPVYSRYEHLKEKLECLSSSLRAKLLTYEILLIDNTPTTSLPEIVERENCLRIVKPAVPCTQQRSYFEAFRVAQGDWALLLDCDLLGKTTLVDRMIASIDEAYDVIRAIRQNRTYPSRLRLLGSKTANFMFNLGSPNKVQDIGSSLALLKREFYQSALSKEYEKFYDFPLFILVVRPLRIKEIAVDVSDTSTKSEYSLSKLTLVFLRMAKLKLGQLWGA